MIDKPRIKRLEEATFEDCIRLEEYNNKRVTKNIEKKNALLERIPFDSCHFIDIDFTRFEIKEIELLDCIFDNCDLSNVVFSERGLFRCVFKNCRMHGATFSECRLENIQMDNVVGNYIDFYKCEMKNVFIKDAIFNEGRFAENITKGLELENVNFTKCDFIRTGFVGTDFSTSIIDSITTDFYSLKGMKVNSGQAVNLSVLLGLEIV